MPVLTEAFSYLPELIDQAATPESQLEAIKVRVRERRTNWREFCKIAGNLVDSMPGISGQKDNESWIKTDPVQVIADGQTIELRIVKRVVSYQNDYTDVIWELHGSKMGEFGEHVLFSVNSTIDERWKQNMSRAQNHIGKTASDGEVARALELIKGVNKVLLPNR